MTRFLAALFVLLAVLAPSPAAAQTARQLGSGEPFAPRSDTAYLLFRTDDRVMEDWFEFLFVRETAPPAGAASPPSLAASHTEAGKNVVKTKANQIFSRAPGSRMFLVAVPPGSYFLAAVGIKQLKGVGTCMCMGTVRFEARANLVTDLGFLLASLEDRRTSIPELASLTDPPTEYDTAPALVAAAIRPFKSGMPLPPELGQAQVVPADYRAVGKFPNYFRTMISRLAPVPGVLAYERDRVVDLKAR